MKFVTPLTLVLFGAFAFTACDNDDDSNLIDSERNVLVGQYADSYLSNSLYPAVTTRLDNFDQEDAYDFQADFVQELVDRGEKVIGWKLGFTGDSPRPFGAPEPVSGRLLESQRNSGGATIDISETFQMAALGVELALYIDRDVSFRTSDFPLDRQTIMSIISAIAPLSEMPELGFEEGKMNINYLDLIANNAGAKQFVVGDRVELSSFNGMIDSIDVVVFRDNQQIATSFTGDALGSQLEALEFLLRQLAERGEGLKAGQIVATGSLGGDLNLIPGKYRYVYEGLGTLEFTLVE